MSVKVRPYLGGDEWEIDVRITLPDGVEFRERKEGSGSREGCGASMGPGARAVADSAPARHLCQTARRECRRWRSSRRGSWRATR